MLQQEVKAIFDQVAQSLRSQPWFRSGRWKLATHQFPEHKPSFLTFHVFKDHWFNEEREGIHIESFLAFDPKARKKSSITIHLLHYDVIPGTNLKRRDISVPIVDAIFDEVSSWDGYKFRAGKYGLQPFSKPLNGAAIDFASTLTAEVTRLCQVVGPEVDRVLALKMTSINKN